MDWLDNILKRKAPKPVDEAEPTPPKGRSSVEDADDLGSMMSRELTFYGGLDPKWPHELLGFLTRMGMINPDINVAIQNLVALANSGHSLILQGADPAVEAAHERLNRQAYQLYRRSAGIDGLINHYIRQVALTGAISSEDVVAADLSGVDKVALVPVRQIRFNWDGNDYIPFQKVNFDNVELNPLTYHYYAFQTVENSPYALPLFAAAVQALLVQADMQKNIKFIIRKLGLLGLVSAALKPPPKQPNETVSEHSARKKSYLTQVVNAMQENFYQGLMVGYDDMTIEHHNITGEARGSMDVWQMNEEQVASGMGVDPIVLGRSYHTTETFANVTYMFLVRQANNIRQLPKRRMEETYRLDLRLQGIPVEDVALQFKPNPARDPLAEAQALETRERAILSKVRAGVIEPDVAAQEMGYDFWFDPELMNNTSGGSMMPMMSQRTPGRILKYNTALNKYEFSRPRVVLRGDTPSTEGGRLGTGRRLVALESAVERVMKRYAADYLDAVEPYIKNANRESLAVLEGFLNRKRAADFASAEVFADEVFTLMSEVYVGAFDGAKAKKAIKSATEEIYAFYRLEDTAALPKGSGFTFAFDAIDGRVKAFMKDVDRMYLSKFIYNEPTEKSITSFLVEQFTENGEGLFGRTSRETLDTFMAMATDRIEPLTEYETRRIIDTSVQRMRNYGNIRQLAESEIDTAIIFNADPKADICIHLNGTKIQVGDAADAVARISEMTPDEFAASLQPVTPELVDSVGVDQAVKDGYGFPPYHPNCKTRLIAG